MDQGANPAGAVIVWKGLVDKEIVQYVAKYWIDFKFVGRYNANDRYHKKYFHKGEVAYDKNWWGTG
jgi:hypothetical protein